MNHNIILVAETGSDITAEVAAAHGIYLVPMHVSMGGETYDDGSFPADEICNYYNRTGELPQTSGSSPADFEKIFDEIHAEHPEKHILHLAYSAVTTCSYQSAIVAAEDRDYVTSIDTKHVSVGQYAAVLRVQKFLDDNPEISIAEAVEEAYKISKGTHMSFVPKNLSYLHAGGRVSNAAYMGSRLLNLHPCIELDDGYLLAKKKYRGKLSKVATALVDDFIKKHQILLEKIYLIATPNLAEDVRIAAETAVKEHGALSFEWVKTGCVITTHGGEGAFGIVGFSV